MSVLGTAYALIDDGGEITIADIADIDCAATAADWHNTPATQVRRNSETLSAPLERVDKAIRRYNDIGEATDEISRP